MSDADELSLPAKTMRERTSESRVTIWVLITVIIAVVTSVTHVTVAQLARSQRVLTVVKRTLAIGPFIL